MRSLLEVTVEPLARRWHRRRWKRKSMKANRKVLRQLEQIGGLPGAQQPILLKTICTVLENAALQSARRA